MARLICIGSVLALSVCVSAAAAEKEDWSQFPLAREGTLAMPQEEAPSMLTCTEWLERRKSQVPLRELQYLVEQFKAERAIPIAGSIDKACQAYPWLLWIHAFRMVLSGDRPPVR